MNFRLRAFWITLGITYLYIAIFNLIAHTFLISPFIGSAMTAINADFTKFRVYFLMLTWLVITVGTVYFTIQDTRKDSKVTQAIVAGALISIIADGTWVFTNIAFVPAISAFPFAIAELAWHAIHGGLGGILALKTYEWLRARK